MGKEPIVNRLVPMRRWTFSSFSFGSLLRAFQLHVGGPQLVGRDLLLHEGGVGLVAIERLDHPIAIPPGGDEEVIGLEAGRVGVAHQVEPVAAPALAVPRRREQAVDELFVGVGRLVVDELLHLLGRGRQAVQVEIGAAGEGAAVGFGSEVEFLLLELGEDEGVDGIADAAASFTAGTAGRTGFLERPPASRPLSSDAVEVHFAPALIQSRMALTSAAVSAVLPGGICTSPSRRTAL